MKKIVCNSWGKIVYATVNELTHTIGNDMKDITDDCIKAVLEHMAFKAYETGYYCYKIEGFGKLEFTKTLKIKENDNADKN